MDETLYLSNRAKANLKHPVLFRTESEAFQRAILGAIRESAAMSGFHADDLGVTAYELGTRSVAMARETGIKIIGSLCIHQNWADGGFWTIKGERVDLPPGKHRLTINKESWSRIVGLDLENLKSALRESADSLK